MMKYIFKKWKADQKGATAIEYGLIAGGVALAVVATVFAIGDDLASIFQVAVDYIAEALANM